MAVDAPDLGWLPAALEWGRPSAPPHSAGVLQVGWPQTPVPWVGTPRPLGGHGLRLADLSEPRPEAQKLTHLRTPRPPHFPSPSGRSTKPEPLVPDGAVTSSLCVSTHYSGEHLWRGAQAPRSRTTSESCPGCDPRLGPQRRRCAHRQDPGARFPLTRFSAIASATRRPGGRQRARRPPRAGPRLGAEGAVPEGRGRRHRHRG